jgi:hypothetical protein
MAFIKQKNHLQFVNGFFKYYEQKLFIYLLGLLNFEYMLLFEPHDVFLQKV